MRWALGLVLVLLAVGGALYGVGVFLLPNALEVSRSIEIDRPRATVFALANDLHIARQWSPFNAADPSAEYTFSDDAAGEGQSVSWNGSAGDVPQGSLTILGSSPRLVHMLMTVGEKASFDVAVDTQRADSPESARTRVTMTVRSACGEGLVNVPCRYSNLMTRRTIETLVDDALTRLKGMAEHPQMPRADFEGLRPEFENLPPEPFLYIEPEVSLAITPEDHATTPAEMAGVQARRVTDAMRQARVQVEDALQRYHLTRTGPLLRITTLWVENERIAFRIGYPFSGPAPLVRIGEKIGETPSGRMMRVIHDGPYASLPETYARATAFLCAHQIYRCDQQVEQRGLPWEEVVEDGEGPEAHVRIQIYFPIK